MGIEVALLAAGTAMSAMSSIQKGQATKQAADYNAAVDQQRAAGEIDQANANTQDFIRKGSDQEASSIAARGATGVTEAGSPLMVDENTIRQVALGAARTLQGGQVRAGRLQDDAQLQKMKGENAVTASYLDAGTSLLTGAYKGFGGKVGGGAGPGLSLSGTGGIY